MQVDQPASCIEGGAIANEDDDDTLSINAGFTSLGDYVWYDIDGDSTVIEGADCWQDARIADAFALVSYFHLLPAVFAGFPPGTPTGCANPPETSFWDPR